MSDENIDKLQDSAIAFLGNDFNQCFEQARYYDGQIVDIFKFLSTFYTTVASIAIGLYQFALEKKLDLSAALVSGLVVALVFGVCMFFLIVRNRIYFVFCMRYINEQRGLFLASKPFGFENKTKMYTNHKKPPFYNLLSSQSWWMYTVALLNAALLGTALYIAKQSLSVIGWSVSILFIIQNIAAISYLESKEHKSASAAVFEE